LTLFVAFAFADEAVEKAADEAVEEVKAEAPKAKVHAVHPFYGLYGHQLQWPGIRLPGLEGTCWGCRGKRSAEEAAPANDGKVFGTGHNSFVGQTVWGFPHGKKIAYYHPYRFYGYHHLGKRSAKPGHLGYYGYPYRYFGYPYYHALKPLKAGTALHPGHATSFVERSPQGAKA
jgi:hypothetical protein